MIAPEAVATFERLDGFTVVRSFGVVRGEAYVPRNVLRATFRSIGTLIGLSGADYLTDAERARGEALARLLTRAQALGANGVVGLSFEADEHSDGSTRVLAFGKAVVLEAVPL